MMFMALALAAQLFSVTIFYGPPMLMTVYVDEQIAVPTDPEELERLVIPSLCKAIELDIRAMIGGSLPPGVKREIPDFAFPAPYEILQWERVAGHGYQPIARGMGSLRECPPIGGQVG